MTRIHHKARLLAAAMACAAAAPAGAVTLDLLILYDSYTASYFKGDAPTALKSWVDQMNVMNQNSQVDIQWRLVGTEAHEAPGTSMGQVLDSVTKDTWVKERRKALGADFVSQIHKMGSCGVAWLGPSANYAFSVVGPGCGPNTLAHELGHNMGLAHSRAQGDTGGTRYRYGLGHGVDGKFATLMAYPSAYHASRVPKYSNPTLQCSGLPCGVPVGQPEEAYAALALNNVREELSAFYPTAGGGGGGGQTTGVTVYRDFGFGGYSATLKPGSYRRADLEGKGVRDNDLSSLKVPAGYTIELYADDNFAGTKTVYTADNAALPFGVNDTTSSVIVKTGTTPTPDVTYEVKARHSGLCLDLPDEGNQLQQRQCSGAPSQAWQFHEVEAGKGKYELINAKSGKCMDVAGFDMAAGAVVLQWTCKATNNNNQLWYPIGNGDGTTRLQAVHSGKVLDVRGAATTAGAPLIQWPWHGGNNQRWVLRRLN